jgi:hypothetical protein
VNTIFVAFGTNSRAQARMKRAILEEIADFDVFGGIDGCRHRFF